MTMLHEALHLARGAAPAAFVLTVKSPRGSPMVSRIARLDGEMTIYIADVPVDSRASLRMRCAIHAARDINELAAVRGVRIGL